MVSGEGDGCGVVPLPTVGGVCGPERGLFPSQEKCKLHAEKVKFGAHFCVL